VLESIIYVFCQCISSTFVVNKQHIYCVFKIYYFVIVSLIVRAADCQERLIQYLKRAIVSSGTLKTAYSYIQSVCSFLQLAYDFYAVREVLFVGILNVDFAFICHHCH